MQILSFQDRAFPAYGEKVWRSSLRVLRSSSGNAHTAKHARSDTKKAPSSFGSRHKGRLKHGNRKTVRYRPYPWQIDCNFIRYEFQTDRYLAYRDKAKESNEQIWSEEVEDCFQYGKHLSFPSLGSKCRVPLTTCKR
jgi:hypothetical protein